MPPNAAQTSRLRKSSIGVSPFSLRLIAQSDTHHPHIALRCTWQAGHAFDALPALPFGLGVASRGALFPPCRSKDRVSMWGCNAVGFHPLCNGSLNVFIAQTFGNALRIERCDCLGGKVTFMRRSSSSLLFLWTLGLDP